MTADIGSDILNTVTVKTRDVPRLRYNADEQVLSALIKKFIRSYEKMLKKINLKMILCGVAVLFGLISALMFFAPALKVETVLGDDTVSGMQIAFGDKDEGFAVSAYMLPFFLAIAGTVVAVVAMLGKGGKIVPIDACKVGAGAIVGGIFSIIAAVVAVVPVFVCKD